MAVIESGLDAVDFHYTYTVDAVNDSGVTQTRTGASQFLSSLLLVKGVRRGHEQLLC